MNNWNQTQEEAETIDRDEMLVDMRNACKFLGLSEKSVRKIPKEKLPVYRTEGNHRRYKIQELMCYVNGKPNTVKENPACTLEDITKCSVNFNYFYTNFCYIVSMSKGVIKPKDVLRSDILESLTHDQRILIAGERQSSKTTFLCAYALWLAIFKPCSTIAVFSHNHATKEDIHERISYMYHKLPKELQVSFRVFNKRTMAFNNRSQIDILVPDPCSCRGRSIKYALYDEAAFVNYKTFSEHWTSMYPVLTCIPDSQIVMISSHNIGSPNYFDLLMSGGFFYDPKTHEIDMKKYNEWKRFQLQERMFLSDC